MNDKWRMNTESESVSHSYFTTGGLPPINLSWRQAPWAPRGIFVFQRNTCCCSPYVTSSLTRQWVYPLMLNRVESYVMTDGPSATPSGACDQICITVWQLRVCWCGAPSLWREDRSVVYNCCWPPPVHSFSGPSPMGLATIFYCLRFETWHFVASYDSQGYSGNIRSRLHTGF
jgi:hypothetical protein